MSTHRIFVKKHFGYSKEDDEFVTSSDNVRISYDENTDPVYHYEKTDKAAELHKIIANIDKTKKRLSEETNEIKIKRLKTILKNNTGIILRNKDYIETKMKMNIAQIIATNSL